MKIKLEVDLEVNERFSGTTEESIRQYVYETFFQNAINEILNMRVLAYSSKIPPYKEQLEIYEDAIKTLKDARWKIKITK